MKQDSTAASAARLPSPGGDASSKTGNGDMRGGIVNPLPSTTCGMRPRDRDPQRWGVVAPRRRWAGPRRPARPRPPPRPPRRPGRRGRSAAGYRPAFGPALHRRVGRRRTWAVRPGWRRSAPLGQARPELRSPAGCPAPRRSGHAAAKWRATTISRLRCPRPSPSSQAKRSEAMPSPGRVAMPRVQKEAWRRFAPGRKGAGWLSHWGARLPG